MHTLPAAAMAVAVLGQRVGSAFGHAAFLIQSGQRVVLARESDDGPTAVGLRHQGGRHGGDTALDVNAGAFDFGGVQFRGAMLGAAHLGQGPDPVGQTGVVIKLGVRPVIDFFGMCR